MKLQAKSQKWGKGGCSSQDKLGFQDLNKIVNKHGSCKKWTCIFKSAFKKKSLWEITCNSRLQKRVNFLCVPLHGNILLCGNSVSILFIPSHWLGIFQLNLEALDFRILKIWNICNCANCKYLLQLIYF